ncbi:MAG: hypothetical protein AABZ30_07300 [Myxococcota bacterium]
MNRGSRLRAGVDEAGRGPVLGPLVVAAVWLDAAAARSLRRAGVRDSKEFGAGDAARAERARLAVLITASASYVAYEAVAPREVDRHVLVGGLDRLERAVVLRLLAQGPPHAAVIADGRRLFAPLRAKVPELRALDRADGRYVAVAAASIIAKARRDALFLADADAHGDLAPMARRGMGYVNPATRAFLLAYVARHGRLPPETRLSWRWRALHELLGRDPRADIPAASRAQQRLLP